MNDGRIAGLSAFLSNRRALCGALVIVLLSPACVPIGQTDDRIFPPSDVQPDLAAIVKVVDDVYRTQGFERPVLFLDTGEVCDSILPRCVPPGGGVFPALKTQLETDLQVKVRSLSEADFSDPSVPALTPVLPETGEVGVSVSLGRFSVDEEGLLRVRVSVARSGLDGAFIEYVLEPADDGWTIKETIFDEAVP